MDDESAAVEPQQRDSQRRGYQPEMSDAGLSPSHEVIAVDEYGQTRAGFIAGETALTLFLDGREIVTLMTLGTQPEALAIGYLRNQRFIDKLEEIRRIEEMGVRIVLNHKVEDLIGEHWFQD